MGKTTTRRNSKPKAAPADPERLVDPTAEQEAEAEERRKECLAAIEATLQRFNCRIIPQISGMEPVGHYGSKVQLEAKWWLVPLPNEG